MISRRIRPRARGRSDSVATVRSAKKVRCTATVRRPFLQHAGVQPFLDEPHDTSVRNEMLDKVDGRAMGGHGVEESTDVDVAHPVHLLRQQTDVERIQRTMLAASRPESVRSPGSPSRRWR